MSSWKFIHNFLNITKRQTAPGGGENLRKLPRLARNAGMHRVGAYLSDTQEDLELSEMSIEDSSNDGTSKASRIQSRQGSSAGLASVSSSVAFDVSLRAAAHLAMLEPNSPAQRHPCVDEVSIFISSSIRVRHVALPVRVLIDWLISWVVLIVGLLRLLNQSSTSSCLAGFCSWVLLVRIFWGTVSCLHRVWKTEHFCFC